MERAIDPLLVLLGQLSDPFRELRDGVRRALDIAAVDPEMGLARSRKVLELLVREVYQRRVGQPPGTRPLENLLQRLVKDGHWPVRLEAYATAVRMLGNVGVHRFGEKVTAGNVFHSLSQLLPILEWYCDCERPDAVVARSETLRPATPSPDPPPAWNECRSPPEAPPAAEATRVKRAWERLHSLARLTHRIWPLVVEGQSHDRNGLSYSLSGLGDSPGAGCPQIRLGSRVFWAIQPIFPR